MATAQIRPDWTIGTLNLTAGVVEFTTTDSMLQTAAIQAGDSLITESGLVLIIATITGQNAGTLMEPCPVGAAGIGQPLRIRFQPDGSRYNGAAADLVQLLGSGNVYEFAGLDGTGGGVPVFTGAGTMDVVPSGDVGIQDPNGNLGELAGLALAANKFLRSDGNADLTQGDLTALGAALLSLTGTNGNIPVMTGAGTVASRPIVGTVSQSGGIPTGSIIEVGGRNDFGYVRFSGGVQICWGVSTLYEDVSTPAGAIFKGTNVNFGAMPAVFSSQPSVIALGTDGGGGGWVGMEVFPSAVAFGSFSIRNYEELFGSSRIFAVAIGRWF